MFQRLPAELQILATVVAILLITLLVAKLVVTAI